MFVNKDFSQLSQIWRNVCGGNGLKIHPYAHIHWRRRCSNTLFVYQMDVGCRWKGSKASTIAQLHHVHMFMSQDFSQLCECASIYPSTVEEEGDHIQFICIRWMWDVKGCTSSIIALWNWLHTCLWPRISANSPKSVFVMVMEWYCIHMCIHIMCFHMCIHPRRRYW